jgi:ribonuclease HI
MGKQAGPAGAGWALYADADGATEPLIEGRAYLGPLLTNNIAEWAALALGLPAGVAAGVQRLVVRPDSGLLMGQLPADEVPDVTWSDGRSVPRHTTCSAQFVALRRRCLGSLRGLASVSVWHVRAHQSAADEVFGNKHVDILAKQGRNDSDSLGTTDPGYQLCKECVPGFLVAAAAAAAPSPASVSSGLVGAAGGAGAIVSDGECSGDEDGGGDAPPHIYPDEWAWLAAVEPPPVNARPTMKDLPTKTSDLYGQCWEYMASSWVCVFLGGRYGNWWGPWVFDA